jgi:Protein of unknown function (DUF3611)
MADTLNNGSTPVAVKKIATSLQRLGRFGFLLQLALAIVSGLLLLASFAWTATHGTIRNTGGGLVFSTLSLLVLLAGVFWFFRYTQIAGKFRDAATRPSKADTVKLLRSGVTISSVGLGLGILGAEVLTLNLFMKSLTVLNPFAMLSATYSSTNSIATIVVQPIDVSIPLANTQTILAHLVALLCSLWLINNVAKQSS